MGKRVNLRDYSSYVVKVLYNIVKYNKNVKIPKSESTESGGRKAGTNEPRKQAMIRNKRTNERTNKPSLSNRN